MSIAALSWRIPKENPIVPVNSSKKEKNEDIKNKNTIIENNTPNSLEKSSIFNLVPTNEVVSIDNSMKTKQFYQLWLNLFLNITCGIGIISVAKTMINDVYSVDASYAAAYVSALSISNLAGRFIWANASDYLGRKQTYGLFFATGIPLYASIPFTSQFFGVSDGIAGLVCFSGATLTLLSYYGAGFSCGPGFVADLFGAKNAGAINGRLLTAWSGN